MQPNSPDQFTEKAWEAIARTPVGLDTIVENHRDLERSGDRNVTILVAVIYWGMARMGDRNAGDRVRILLVCSIT